eukprot:1915865-Pyramimonas_sp.AAC.1
MKEASGGSPISRKSPPAPLELLDRLRRVRAESQCDDSVLKEGGAPVRAAVVLLTDECSRSSDLRKGLPSTPSVQLWLWLC